MICDVQTPDGDPYVGDPRHILRRALERASEMGFDTFNVGPELEFFYSRTQTAPSPSTTAATSTDDVRRGDGARGARRPRRCSSSGFKVEYSHHEVGISQHEIACASTTR
jgi:glutamine synthetase